MTSRELLVVLGLAGALSGCAVLPLWRAPRVCVDGDPPRPLVHPSCPRGLCGYSCLPGRWRLVDGKGGTW